MIEVREGYIVLRHKGGEFLFTGATGSAILAAAGMPAYEWPYPATPPQQATPAEPIPMVLHCPACGLQHIDAPWRPGQYLTNDQITGAEPVWNNPPHRSHLCHQCCHIWRPADVPTTGVASLQTKGRSDSSAMQAASTIAAAQPDFEMAELLNEVRSTFTRDDDLPDGLLPRIDAALAAWGAKAE